MTFSTRKAFLLLALLFFASAAITANAGRIAVAAGARVLPCAQITLQAQYLAEVHRGSGPGFHFILENKTSKAIKLAMPVPSSAHFFAEERGRWLWRASTGSGGSLVNAENLRGPMFAFQLPASAAANYLTVGPHGSEEWDQSVAENPVLQFKATCRLCNHPDDRLYRVVFAYAYLPRPEEKAGGILGCGIRSNFVDVPPRRY